jgi:uncharacterized membrane protein YhaH (DUF805 family)
LHNWGFFEILGFFFCFQIIYEGSKMDIMEQFGFMLALMGRIFVAGIQIYGTSLHTKRLRGIDKETIVNLSIFWNLVCMIPMAIKFQSTAFGYLTFFCVFTLLGYRMMFFGLGYACGWDDKRKLESCAFCTFIMLLVYIPERIMMPEQSIYWLGPFSSAICVLGGHVLYLAFLIMSSREYKTTHYHDDPESYKWRRNC